MKRPESGKVGTWVRYADYLEQELTELRAENEKLRTSEIKLSSHIEILTLGGKAISKLTKDEVREMYARQLERDEHGTCSISEVREMIEKLFSKELLTK